MHYIYKITNTKNDKIYIGLTNNLKQRISQYKSAAEAIYIKETNSQVITRAIQKYGFEFFVFEHIASCRNVEDANQTEITMIAQYKSQDMNIGYNIDAGGKAMPRSQITRDKISKSNIGRPGVNLGRVLTQQVKDNMSAAAMGKPGTNTGKTFSNEWCDKISKALTGIVRSEETKMKVSESKKGTNAPNRKLTFEQAEEIRREYSTGEISQRGLARKYSISGACIRLIIRKLTYMK